MEIAPQSSADSTQPGPRPANCRTRISNKPRRMVIDGRSQLGRRLHDLAESFAAQLGGWPALSDMMAANVRKASELTALAEQSRAEALRNGNIDPLALVRLEGAADRAVRRLGIKLGNAPAPGPTLAEYLASLEAEQSQSEPEDEGEPERAADTAPDGAPANDAVDDEAAA